MASTTAALSSLSSILSAAQAAQAKVAPPPPSSAPRAAQSTTPISGSNAVAAKTTPPPTLTKPTTVNFDTKTSSYVPTSVPAPNGAQALTVSQNATSGAYTLHVGQASFAINFNGQTGGFQLASQTRAQAAQPSATASSGSTTTASTSSHGTSNASATDAFANVGSNFAASLANKLATNSAANSALTATIAGGSNSPVSAGATVQVSYDAAAGGFKPISGVASASSTPIGTVSKNAVTGGFAIQFGGTTIAATYDSTTGVYRVG